MQGDLGKLLIILFVFGGGFLLLRPLVQALADRLRHRGMPEQSELGAEVLEELAPEPAGSALEPPVQDGGSACAPAGRAAPARHGGG